MDVEDEPLTVELTRTYLVDLVEVDQSHHVRILRYLVSGEHTSHGGLSPSDDELNSLVSKALNALRDAGEFETGDRSGHWRRVKKSEFPELAAKHAEAMEAAEVQVGTGPEVVYGWYFPRDLKLARLEQKTRFPIKIGCTASGPQKRILDSIGQAPEKPVIGFVHHVDESAACEAWYHAALKVRGRKIEEAIGKEWFMTNLDDLREMASKLEEILSENGDEE